MPLAREQLAGPSETFEGCPKTGDMTFDDFFNTAAGDAIAELPNDKLERAMVLRNGLVALCEGRGNMNAAVYRHLRREFMNDPAVSSLVPQFVRTAQDTGAIWAFLKDHAGQWEPRRQFVRDQFAPMIDRLERGAALADTVISDTLTSFEAEAVTVAWNKALARREADPAGAITAARTLLETVCKHLLEDEEGNPSYGPNDDLPKLYRMASKRLVRLVSIRSRALLLYSLPRKRSSIARLLCLSITAKRHHYATT